MTERRLSSSPTRQIGRLLIAACVALALATTMGVGSASASGTACRVQITGTGKTFATLQGAVDAARDGARLIVKGTCHGGTFIGRSLAIWGVRTRRSGKPVLDGEAKSRVLVVKPGVKASIRGLTVRNGLAKYTRNSGGISNRGTLTLRDVIVRKNRYGSVHNEGRLRILGHSRVTSNSGGLFNSGRLVLADDAHVRGNAGSLENEGVLVVTGSSSIHHNSGHGVVSTGTVEMGDSSSIYGNSGGGAYNEGTMVLGGSSSIRDNGWAPYGGGVVTWGTTTTLTLNGASSISGNRASGHGGGVWSAYGTVTLNESSAIRDNVSGGDGGGVWNDAFRRVALAMTGSSTITGNSAFAGGGVFNLGPRSLATFVGVSCAPQTLANVYGNTPDDCLLESQ